MQIKTTMRYHFIFTRMVRINVWVKTSVGKDVEKLEHLFIDGGHIKWFTCGKEFGASSES